MILSFNSKILSFNNKLIDYPVASTPSGSLVTTATLSNASIVAQSPFTGASSGNSFSFSSYFSS